MVNESVSCRFLLFLLCLSFLELFVVTAAAGETTADAPQTVKNSDLLEWVVMHGGYFNPKQEIRQEGDLVGVFCTEPIREREVLASIPWKVVISANSKHRFDNCDTVQLLVEEMNLGNKSFHALHVASLKDAAQEHARLLPTNWSKKGKELLLQITGNGLLPPEDPFMLNFKWKHKCEGPSPLHKDATLLVMTHGEDFGMVPITDKYNCRGGNWTGAYFSKEAGDEVALEIRADRDLQPGEQIFTNYKDYGPIGTPELLRDYGFVEWYPQRWIFHEQNIAFDLEETTGGMQVRWLRKVKGKTHHKKPPKEALEFLREQLQRLQTQVYPELRRISKDQNQRQETPELPVLSQFCRNTMTAMSHAIGEPKIYREEEEEEEEEEHHRSHKQHEKEQEPILQKFRPLPAAFLFASLSFVSLKLISLVRRNKHKMREKRSIE